MLVLVLAFMRASACASQTSVLSELPEQVPENAVPVAQEPVFSEYYSGIDEPDRQVIRDWEAWKALWGEVTRNRAPKPDPPAIDFSGDMVIVAAMGRRSTGGYSISIDEIRRSEGRLFAVVTEVSPGSGCMTTQAFTAPVTAVRIPWSDEPVTFVERKETQDCGRRAAVKTS